MRNVLQGSLFVLTLSTLLTIPVGAQNDTTVTGTALMFGSGRNTRNVTRPFTMTITGETSAADAARYLSTLQEGGQDALMRAIDSNNLGRFSFTGSVGQQLNAVIVDQDNGDTRVRAVFRRPVGFEELRRGLRSVDYPFGYVEVRIDPRTGRGDGTIIPAARIRFRNGNVEIEDFGTFPGRLMGVRVRGRLVP